MRVNYKYTPLEEEEEGGVGWGVDLKKNKIKVQTCEQTLFSVLRVDDI